MGATRRRAWPPPRAGREEGSLSFELVVLLPVLFTLLFLGTQIALFYQARSVAIAAAADGARTAGGENATAADGEAAAWSFIAAAGGDDALPQAAVRAVRTTTEARVTVSGVSYSVIPGWTPRISQDVTVPVERITQ